jgi:hypothetical protein
MSFDLNDIDRASKPKVHSEELEQLRYIKTALDRVAVRVGNEQAAPVYVSIVEGATNGLYIDYRNLSAVAVGATATATLNVLAVTTSLLINVSCDNRALVELKVNGSTIQVLRSSFSSFNLAFKVDKKLLIGDTVSLDITNKGLTVSDFDLTFYGVSVE